MIIRGRQSSMTLLALCTALASPWAVADEFTQEDIARWQGQFIAVMESGRTLWSDGKLGANGVTCARCHPNAANVHPETYPKFQKQLGRVAALWEMINWCLHNTAAAQPLAADDPKMIALQAYAVYERRGIPLDPGKH